MPQLSISLSPVIFAQIFTGSYSVSTPASMSMEVNEAVELVAEGVTPPRGLNFLSSGCFAKCLARSRHLIAVELFFKMSNFITWYYFNFRKIEKKNNGRKKKKKPHHLPILSLARNEHCHVLYKLFLCKIFLDITAIRLLEMESGHARFVLELSVNTAVSIRSDCVGTNVSD